MILSKRKLGSYGLEVSIIGLGYIGMSQSYGPADKKSLLQHCLWHWTENIAADSIKLDSAQMNILDGALVLEKVSGNRYVDCIMAIIDR